MLRARKYGFAWCFRVLSNQYVEISVYANFFKFNGEKKRFERAKVSLLESLRGAPLWRLHLNTIIFSDTLCRITRVRNIVHRRNFDTFSYYSSKIFQFLESICWMARAFIFHLRETCMIIKLTCLTWKPPIKKIIIKKDIKHEDYENTLFNNKQIYQKMKTI